MAVPVVRSRAHATSGHGPVDRTAWSRTARSRFRSSIAVAGLLLLIPGATAGGPPRLIKDMGTKTVMILRNHGTLTVGKSCADAFLRLYNLERACTIQVRALSGGTKINQPNDGVPDKVAEQVSGMATNSSFADKLVWPALLRLLDRKDMSYRN